MHRRSLFVFRRDVRLDDNLGLLRAVQESSEVLLAFICDPKQLTKNPYRSEASVTCLRESLRELAEAVEKRGGQLHLFSGTAKEVIAHLLREVGVDAVYVNEDYTPFSRARDQEIATVCENAGAPFVRVFDALLNHPDAIKNGAGKPYAVFTPFWRASAARVVARPQKLPRNAKFVSRAPTTKYDTDWSVLESTFPVKQLATRPGRSSALKTLKNAELFRAYARERDLPANDRGTTYLSVHLKFGTVSVREAYWGLRNALGMGHPLLRQLYWRDFFTHVAYHSPYVFGESYHREFDRVKWTGSRQQFKAWCEGRTGVPMVDAGMRQLVHTGWMHNRVRMITASFLVKDLHIDWREGEKFFAQHLMDYDPCLNNGNWQWVAGTGCDAQPWFRIFNPWIQQKKFDPQAEYIKRFVPELTHLTATQIHELANKRPLTLKEYPSPIVDHNTERQFTLAAYRV